MNQLRNLGDREKLILMFLLFVILAYVAYSFVYAPLIEKQDELVRTISDEGSAANIEGLRSQQELAQESLDKINKQVDTMINDGNDRTINRQDFLIFLGEKTGKYGVDLRRFRDMGLEEKDGSYRAKFEVDLYGLLTDLQSIVNEIERLGIGYSVTDISLRRNDEKEWLLRDIDNVNRNTWADIEKDSKEDDKSNLSISDQKELEESKKEEERIKLQQQVLSIQNAIESMTSESNKHVIEEAINQITDLSTKYTLLNVLNNKIKRLSEETQSNDNKFEQDKMLDLLINGKSDGNGNQTIIIPEINLNLDDKEDEEVEEVKKASNKLDKLRMHFVIEFVMFRDPSTEYNFVGAVSDENDDYRYIINVEGSTLTKREIKQLISISETFLDNEIIKVEGYIEEVTLNEGNTFKLEEYLKFLKSNKPEYEKVEIKEFTVTVDETNYDEGYIELNVDGVVDVEYSAIMSFSTGEVNLKGKTGTPLKIEFGEDKDGFKIEVAVNYLDNIEKHILDYKKGN